MPTKAQKTGITHTAFVALGSNLQSPKSQVLHAISALSLLPHSQCVATSSLYQTSPIGFDDQADFINAVIQLNTTLAPLDLLEMMLAIENKAGRERPFPNAPRVLDLDLLLYDNIHIATQRLTLPHPRMHERAFVLMPLAEIAPNLTLTTHGSVVKLAQSYKNQGIQKLA